MDGIALPLRTRTSLAVAHVVFPRLPSQRGTSSGSVAARQERAHSSELSAAILTSSVALMVLRVGDGSLNNGCRSFPPGVAFHERWRPVASGPPALTQSPGRWLR